MKQSIILTVLVLFASCDFTGSTPEPKPAPYPVTMDTISMKTDSPSLPKAKEQVTVETSTVTVDNPSADDSHLKKEIEVLEKKISDLQKSTQGAPLKASTYQVIREKQVSEYLHYMYKNRVALFARQGVQEADLAETFKKFFTIAYCDDRVLKWLDEFAEKRNRDDAGRMRLDRNKLTKPDVNTREIINFK